MKSRIKILFSLLAIIQFSCVQNNGNLQLSAMEYFETLSVSHISEKDYGEFSSFEIDETELKINWKTIVCYDDITLRIPATFNESQQLNQDSVQIYFYEGPNDIRIGVNKLKIDSTSNAIQAFQSGFQYTIENGLQFNLLEAQYFESNESNFVVFNSRIGFTSSHKNGFTLLFCDQSDQLLDIGYSSSNILTDKDKVIFTAIINSITYRGKQIMPMVNKIIDQKKIEI